MFKKIFLSLMILSAPVVADDMINTSPQSSNYESIDAYKEAYVDYVSTLIDEKVDAIRINRYRLSNILNKEPGNRAIGDRLFIDAMADKYKTRPSDTEELARRLDILPKGLLISLIVYKTEWGTNDLVTKYSNPFGITNNDGSPKLYKSIDNGVRDFFQLVNTSPEFSTLRDARHNLRRDGLRLETSYLLKYFVSEMEYDNVLFIASKERFYYLD